MGLKGGTARIRQTEGTDLGNRTRPLYRTERSSVLVVSRSATIRHILCLILQASGYNTIEVDEWSGLHRPPDMLNVDLAIVDAEGELALSRDLDYLEKCLAPGVPAIVLTDEPSCASLGSGRMLVAAPKIFQAETIMLMTNALTLLHKTFPLGGRPRHP